MDEVGVPGYRSAQRAAWTGLTAEDGEQLARSERQRRSHLQRTLARIQQRWSRTDGLSQEDLYDSSGLPS